MKLKWILAATLAAAGVAGCADTPYYDNAYAYNGAYYDDYPGYYGPDVSLGFAFSDTERHHHFRDGDRFRDGGRFRDGDRHRDDGRADNTAPSSSRSFAPNDPGWNNGGHSQETDSRG